MKTAAIAEIRLLFKEWRETFLDCCKHQCRKRPTRVLVIGIGKFVDELPLNPQEFPLMATGKKGQYLPLIVKPKNPDVDVADYDKTKPPVFTSDDVAVAEVVTDSAGNPYGHLTGQGATTLNVDIDADPTDGESIIRGVLLVVCDDPSDNATTVELEGGTFVDALPEAPPAP